MNLLRALSLFLCYVALARVSESIKTSTLTTDHVGDALLRMDPTEYYGNLVSCGGNTFLLTRVEKDDQHHEVPWRTRVRLVEGPNGTNMSDPIFLRETVMSHNIAGLCVGGAVYLIGGQYREKRTEAHFRGVYLSTTEATSLQSFASHITKPRLLFNGAHRGCVEKRFGKCVFDGQFRVVHWQGEFHVFSRANTPERHVQVISTSDWASWSDFRMIEFEDLNHHNQIYFLHAEPWNASHMIGVFPGQIRLHKENKSGIFVSWSQNGFNWTRPVQIKNDTSKDGAHVPWMPVGFFGGRLMIMRRSPMSSGSYKEFDATPMKMSMGTEMMFKQQLDIIELPSWSFAR